MPVNKRLLFHVYSLNIGHDSDCSGDYLEVSRLLFCFLLLLYVICFSLIREEGRTFFTQYTNNNSSKNYAILQFQNRFTPHIPQAQYILSPTKKMPTADFKLDIVS